MKKLLFVAVAVAALSFASCGQAPKGGADTDSVAPAEDTTAVVEADTTAADTTVAE